MVFFNVKFFFFFCITQSQPLPSLVPVDAENFLGVFHRAPSPLNRARVKLDVLRLPFIFGRMSRSSFMPLGFEGIECPALARGYE